MVDFLTGDPAQLPAALAAFAKGNMAINPIWSGLPAGTNPEDFVQTGPTSPGSFPEGNYAINADTAAPPNGSQQPQVQPGAAQAPIAQVPKPELDSISRAMETITNAYARVKSGQPEDRITSILKRGSVFDRRQEALMTGQAIASFENNMGTPGFGERLNAIRAGKIAEAEKLAKVQIDDERLQNEKHRDMANEVARLAQLGETQRHNRATENANIIKEILSPYAKLAEDGSFSPGEHAKLTADVMQTVNRSGATTPTEVAEIASGVLAARGMPSIMKVMHVGNTLFSVTRGIDGIPVVKEIGKAEPSNSSPWQDKGPVMDRATGEFLGYLQFNNAVGEYYVRTKDGRLVPQGAVPNAVPSTRSNINQSLTPDQTLKVSDETMTEKQSINQLLRYQKFVNESPQGWDLFATEVIGKVRTAFGDKISPKELVTLAQNGQLQGLIGRMRIQVVGGGVMTEQDAQRVIAALGGDVNSLRNPDVVKTMVGQLVQMKVQRYNEVLLPTYNRQAQMYPSIYPKQDPITIDESMFKTTQEGWPQGATAERDGPDGRKQFWLPSERKWISKESPKATK